MTNTTLQRLMMILMTALMMTSVACSDDSEDLSPSCEGGDLIEVEGDSYCVFIEEGFLAAQCPPDFPNGFEVSGVIVCTAAEDIPEEAVEEELEARGLGQSDGPNNEANNEANNEVNNEVNNNVECTDDSQCPQPSPFADCDGNTLVSILAFGFCDENGACQIDGGEDRIDCGESGAVCLTEIFECVAPEQGHPVEVAEEHRRCDTVDDCVTVRTGCGDCLEDCQGVRADFSGPYDAALDCEDFSGPQCDFACHPDSGLTELACVEGLCVIQAL